MNLVKIIKPINTVRISSIKIGSPYVQHFCYENKNIFQKYQLNKNKVFYIETTKNKIEMINIIKQYEIPLKDCKFFKYHTFSKKLAIYNGIYDDL